MYLHISLYIMYIIYIINSFISEQQSFEMPLKTKLLEAESSPAVPTALGTWIHFPLCPFLANQRELSQPQLPLFPASFTKSASHSFCSI